MFCLRSWVPLLVFLTNASPIYILLFLSANYILQRPCVYCSILLFVLVFSLFDFGADWFEPRWQPSSGSPSLTETASALFSGNATAAQAFSETAALAISALNGTGGALASAALDGAKRRWGEDVSGTVSASTFATGFEWLRSVADKKQFRIPCVDILVRL